MSAPWPKVRLREVLIERREIPDPEGLVNGSMRIVSKISFDSGKIEVRQEAGTKTGMILVRPGDLLVSGINAAKGAIAIYGRENTEPVAATIHYGAYEVVENRADISYLRWYLRSRPFREILFETLSGGIKTEIKASRLLPIRVPLPTLSEQRRLVARIEELAGKIEEARGLRREAVGEAEALVVSSITRALNGISLDGRLTDVLLEKPRNGWSARCDNVETGIPVLTLGAVTGFRYRDNEFKRTSEPTSPNAHYWLQDGDLLITRSNTPELVGHAAIYNGSPSPCIYPDLMMRLVVDEKRADKRFVHGWLRGIPVREYIGRAAKGTSPTMKKISQGAVMNIPFPTRLPLPEQRRIVSYLDSLQSKVDALQRLQSETAAELDALLPSILDKAFRGQM